MATAAVRRPPAGLRHPVVGDRALSGTSGATPAVPSLARLRPPVRPPVHIRVRRRRALRRRAGGVPSVPIPPAVAVALADPVARAPPEVVRLPAGAGLGRVPVVWVAPLVPLVRVQAAPRAVAVPRRHLVAVVRRDRAPVARVIRAVADEARVRGRVPGRVGRPRRRLVAVGESRGCAILALRGTAPPGAASRPPVGVRGPMARRPTPARAAPFGPRPGPLRPPVERHGMTSVCGPNHPRGPRHRVRGVRCATPTSGHLIAVGEPARGPVRCRSMAEPLDVEAMIQRFRERAHAVRNRTLPPVAGEERMQFIRQAEIDYQDFAIVGDAEGTIEDGVLVLRVDLRPKDSDSG